MKSSSQETLYSDIFDHEFGSFSFLLFGSIFQVSDFTILNQTLFSLRKLRLFRFRMF